MMVHFPLKPMNNYEKTHQDSIKTPLKPEARCWFLQAGRYPWFRVSFVGGVDLRHGPSVEARWLRLRGVPGKLPGMVIELVVETIKMLMTPSGENITSWVWFIL